MVAGSFGWSAGGIVTAIKILTAVIRAFDQAKGAKKQHAMSCGFLRQLIPILRRIKNQINDAKDDQLRSDLVEHCHAIDDAYKGFDEFLEKRYNGLSAGQPNKTKQIVVTVKWSLDEMHDKVQKMKERTMAAMQPYMTLMTQEVYSKLDDLVEESRTTATNIEEGNKRSQEITSRKQRKSKYRMTLLHLQMPCRDCKS